MKYLSVKLTKYTQNLYAEKYNMLMKESKDLNKWRRIQYSWIENTVFLTYQFFPISSTDSMQFPVTASYYVDIGKVILKII